MKQEWSKSLEFDKRSIKSIMYTALFMIVTFYTTNTEAINGIIEKYISEDVFTLTILILAYASKKYLTNYSK